MLSLAGRGLDGLYRTLPKELKTKLDMLGSLHTYSDGQHMQSRGDNTRGFSIIKKGTVHFGKMDAGGTFLTGAVFGEGQCYGEFTLFAGLPRTHDAYAVGNVEVRHIPAAAFQGLMDSEPVLARVIITSLTMQLHTALEWIDDIRRYPLKYRLAKIMLQMTADDNNCLAVRHEELADWMGVSRVAIGKALSLFKGAGFVRLKYGAIEVLDRPEFEVWLRCFDELEPLS